MIACCRGNMKKHRPPQDNFINLDVKKLEHIELERKKLLASAMQGVPEMHSLRCPRCRTQLAKESITDVIIFICAQCEGIWLDASSCARILRMNFDGTGRLSKTTTE